MPGAGQAPQPRALAVGRRQGHRCSWYLNEPAERQRHRVPPHLGGDGSEPLRRRGGCYGDSCNGTAYGQLGRHVPQVRQGHAAPRRPAGLQHAHRPHRAVRRSASTHWGVDPLPYHIEPPESPLSHAGDCSRNSRIILSGGGRSFEFFHSEHRQLPTMREFHPWPARHGESRRLPRSTACTDGEWVWVENSRGARFKQKVNGDRRGHAWPSCMPSTAGGSPSRTAAEPNLYGTYESNLNNMTRGVPHRARAASAAPSRACCARSIPCRKATSCPTRSSPTKGDFAVYEPGKPYAMVEEPVVTVIN